MGKSISSTLILRGQDAGRLFLYEDTKLGLGTPEASATMGISLTHSSDPNSFARESLTEKSETLSVSAGTLVTVGASNTEGNSAAGGKIRTAEVNVGAGKGGAVNVSKTYNDTKETIGSQIINAIIDYFVKDE